MTLRNLSGIITGLLLTMVLSFPANSSEFGGRTGFFGGHYHFDEEDTLDRGSATRLERHMHSYRLNKSVKLDIDYDANHEDEVVDNNWKPGHLRLMNTLFR